MEWLPTDVKLTRGRIHNIAARAVPCVVVTLVAVTRVWLECAHLRAIPVMAIVMAIQPTDVKVSLAPMLHVAVAGVYAALRAQTLRVFALE
jgi:hypothetical protein